ncbi:hypothetical protein SAMN05444064_1413 [Pseudomonas syringae]|uniref:hypothetical protein n=1 Tax=Pseudomonas syringae TaxID=317 RepID=UPI0008978E26|nr:hypothetical protein [Pseudomonas syringae]SDX75941.1 hypothetical protein SAMN05444514_1423 [Pseudomonas syringae]SFM82923.1 hypothetical protein SAMN05444064_1413 [Pseudomonas syringae]
MTNSDQAKSLAFAFELSSTRITAAVKNLIDLMVDLDKVCNTITDKVLTLPEPSDKNLAVNYTLVSKAMRDDAHKVLSAVFDIRKVLLTSIRDLMKESEIALAFFNDANNTIDDINFYKAKVSLKNNMATLNVLDLNLRRTSGIS